MKNMNTKWITLSLYGLVLISLYLSFRILIVPSSTGEVSNVATQPTNLPTATLRQVEEVFAPYQMTVHSDSNSYMTEDPKVVEEASLFLADWKLTDVELLDTYSKNEYQEFLLKTGRIEIRFPAATPFALLTHYFREIPDERMGDKINRILISTNQEEPVYLVEDDTQRVYTARRPEKSLQQLVSLYTDNQKAFMISDAYALKDALVFLPRDEMVLPHQVYLVETQPNSFFINQLFEDTNELRDGSNEHLTAYSDNLSELRINKLSGLLTYFRNKLDPTTIPPYQQIRDSFHLLKFIDTWTHDTLFTGYNENNAIEYRRFLHGYPVFSSQERGIVQMEMANAYPVRIQYPTEVIQTHLEDREKMVTLPSAKAIIEQLDEKGFSFSEIEMFQIGYEWVTSEESTRITEMIPSWFIKMDGTWRSLDTWLTVSEENQYGL